MPHIRYAIDVQNLEFKTHGISTCSIRIAEHNKIWTGVILYVLNLISHLFWKIILKCVRYTFSRFYRGSKGF